MAQSHEEILAYRRDWKRRKYHEDAGHRERRIAQAKVWADANPERRFANLLRRRYGIALEDYYAMLDAQDGVCAICENPETKRDHRTDAVIRLAVDHCHETGEVRGIALQPLQQRPWPVR